MSDATTKTCMTCHEIKPRTEFYRCKRWNDGLSYRCKACDKAAAKKYTSSAKGIETTSAWRKEYVKTDKHKESRKAYKLSEIGKAANKRYREGEAAKEAFRRYRQKNRIKERARCAVSNAIRSGKIPSALTLKCQECGIMATGYHHHLGYEEEHRLHIIPVCKACHTRLDTAIQKAY